MAFKDSLVLVLLLEWYREDTKRLELAFLDILVHDSAIVNAMTIRQSINVLNEADIVVT